MQRTVRIM